MNKLILNYWSSLICVGTVHGTSDC